MSIFLKKKKKRTLRCRSCARRDVIRQGVKVRNFRVPPAGRKKVIIQAHIQRLLKCKPCGRVLQQEVEFDDGKKSYTRGYGHYKNDLRRVMTIRDKDDQ